MIRLNVIVLRGISLSVSRRTQAVLRRRRLNDARSRGKGRRPRKDAKKKLTLVMGNLHDLATAKISGMSQMPPEGFKRRDRCARFSLCPSTFSSCVSFPVLCRDFREAEILDRPDDDASRAGRRTPRRRAAGDCGGAPARDGRHNGFAATRLLPRADYGRGLRSTAQAPPTASSRAQNRFASSRESFMIRTAKFATRTPGRWLRKI